MKITITEALSKLKILNSRINNEIKTQTPIVTLQVGKVPSGYSSVEDFNKKVKASYQSITDLIKQRNSIKSAIVKSNALTEVKIGNILYTVASAIERKNSIEYEKQLLSVYTNTYNRAIQQLDNQNKLAQDKLDALITATFGKDSKVDPDNIKSISEQFWKQNEFKLCDPLKLSELIQTMNNNIEEFMSDVDVQLTISNSTQFIEI